MGDEPDGVLWRFYILLLLRLMEVPESFQSGDELQGDTMLDLDVVGAKEVFGDSR